MPFFTEAMISPASCPHQHIGVGHAWHRLVCIALATAIAGGLHAHQPRVLPVLHVANELALLDQDVVAGGSCLHHPP